MQAGAICFLVLRLMLQIRGSCHFRLSCKSSRAQALQHRPQSHSFGDYSYCRKSKWISKSNGGVAELKDRDYYLIERSTWQDASMKRASCVSVIAMLLSCSSCAVEPSLEFGFDICGSFNSTSEIK